MRASLLFLALALALATLPAGPLAAGSAGNRNGGIQGVVYDDAGRPLSGANVVAVRQIAPQVIRSASTDEMGNYFIGDVYLGEYVLGFSKFGFKTRDTAGSGAGGTVTGPTVKVFVESGMTSVAPRVTLISEPDSTAGTVNITVLDLTSNAPIENAAVSLGAFGAPASDTPGVYRAQVRPVYGPDGVPLPQGVRIMAEGFEPFVGAVTVAPNLTQAITFRLNPTAVEVNGRLLVSPPGGVDLTQVAVRVTNLNPAFSQGAVSSTGQFSLKLPASTSSIPRQFTITFHLVGFAAATVPNVMAPTTGALTLTEDVVLRAEMVTAVGQVFLSNSQPGGDSVLVRELGRSFPISGGQFSIPLPVGRELTLFVTARTNGRIETAEEKVTASSPGGADPVFNLPLIITKPGN